jgi:hypothetical protein
VGAARVRGEEERGGEEAHKKFFAGLTTAERTKGVREAAAKEGRNHIQPDSQTNLLYNYFLAKREKEGRRKEENEMVLGTLSLFFYITTSLNEQFFGYKGKRK